ncbi:FecR domain-containing protein [Pseudomonadota bacterium AL_CKDN230030165-1A_HGKHYDSX7]
MSASPWYRATPDAGELSPDVAQRALEWLVDLQDAPACPERLQAWQNWRAAHPDHERAWQRIESVQRRLQPLAGPGPSSLAQAALAAPRTGVRSPDRRRALKALAIMAIAGGAAWQLEPSVPWRRWAADFRTVAGERRRVVLADGTQITLNTGSAIDVRFDVRTRRVALIAGEILVVTAPDIEATPRPFLVETDHGTARALGTEYAVRRHADGTEVNVFAGAVQVRTRLNGDQMRVLHAGYRACYTADSINDDGPTDDTNVAWKDGFIVARGMRLDAFVAELARYTDQTLVCDPAVAGLRVSGSFPVSDIGMVLDTVSTTLKIRTETRTRFWRDERHLLPA